MIAMNTLETTLAQLERAEVRLEEIERERETGRRRLESLKLKLQQEFQDIEQLERFQWPELFVVGDDKTDRLEEEREDFYRTALELNALERELELLDFEAKVLTEKLEKAPEIRRAYTKQVQQQSKKVAGRPAKVNFRLARIHKEMTNLHRQQQELREATEAGELLLASLTTLTGLIEALRLEPAGQWPDYHSLNREAGQDFLRFAQKAVPEIDLNLRSFTREMEDVQPNFRRTDGVTLEAGKQFLRAVARSLAAAWLQPQRLRQLDERLQTLLQTVDNILPDLQLQLRKTTASIGELHAEQKALLENPS